MRMAKPTASSGASLLELIAAIGVTALAATLSGGALARLGRATSVQSARVLVMSALLDARRRAYAADATTDVTVRAEDSVVTVHTAEGQSIASRLPPGSIITGSVASGRVRFFASGLADNATVTVGGTDGAAAEERVVVNQRGLVR